MRNVRKPSLIFGLITTMVFFIGFFLKASENRQLGEYAFYAGLGLGGIYWVWSIIEVIGADDLKRYQKTFWLIIVVAIPFFGALLYNILHQTRNKMVA